jgi:hypothetical protein
VKVTPFRARWIGRLGALLVRLLGATWRIETSGWTPRDGELVIFAFLHGDMLIPAAHYRRTQAAIVISQHGDGELIAQVVGRLGFVPVRGSSTRGGARAVRELLRQHAARQWAITPDGPRGPRGSVHEGVVQLASDTGRAIVPAGFAVRRGCRLRSWDEFVIPAPFTRIAQSCGPLLAVPKDIDAQQRTAVAHQLEEALRQAGERAQARLAGKESSAPGGS